MKLTGKCKEYFKKWFISDFRKIENDQWAVLELNAFYRQHESMQWGVLVDFFDSVGIHIEISKMPTFNYYYWMINDSDEENEFETRPEARTAAIEKANELYNNNHEQRKDD